MQSYIFARPSFKMVSTLSVVGATTERSSTLLYALKKCKIHPSEVVILTHITVNFYTVKSKHPFEGLLPV